MRASCSRASRTTLDVTATTRATSSCRASCPRNVRGPLCGPCAAANQARHLPKPCRPMAILIPGSGRAAAGEVPAAAAGRCARDWVSRPGPAGFARPRLTPERPRGGGSTSQHHRPRPGTAAARGPHPGRPAATRPRAGHAAGGWWSCNGIAARRTRYRTRGQEPVAGGKSPPAVIHPAPPPAEPGIGEPGGDGPVISGLPGCPGFGQGRHRLHGSRGAAHRPAGRPRREQAGRPPAWRPRPRPAGRQPRPWGPAPRLPTIVPCHLLEGP